MRHGPLTSARRFAYLAFAVLLAGGLAWGLATAFASGASPSPSPGSTTLRIGWTEEPDNLNPFIGYQNETYEIWALNYDLLFGYGSQQPATTSSTWRAPFRPPRTEGSRPTARPGRSTSARGSSGRTVSR